MSGVRYLNLFELIILNHKDKKGKNETSCNNMALEKISLLILGKWPGNSL